MRWIAERLLCALTLSFLGAQAWASSGITYQGRLLAPNGVPVTSSNVQFKMQIRTPGVEDCLLYEEIRTADLSMTSGVFALSVGDGSGTRTDAHGADWNLFETLSNRRDFHFSSGECGAGSSYSPNPTDNRKFRVSFNLGSGWETLPIQVINYIPMSVETYAVGGFPASSLFRVEDAGVIGNVAALTTTQYNNLVDLADGSSSVYEKSGSLNGSTLPSIGSGESVRWNGTSWESYAPLASGDETDPSVQAFAKTSLPTCLAGEVLKSDGTTLSCVTDTSGTLPDVGTAGTYTKVTTDAKGRVTLGDTLDEADLPNITTAGKVSGNAITSGEIAGTTSINTSGNIQTSGDITTTGNLSVSGSATTGSFSTRLFDLYESTNTHKIGFLAPSTLSDYTLTFPATAGTSGQVLSTDGSGALSWMNAATGSVTSVAGTSPIVIGGTASAPIVTLSDSGVGAATYGSATEVPVITVDSKGRITSASNTTIAGVSPVGSTLSTGKVWVGDAAKAQERFLGIADIRSTALGNNPVFPLSCTNAQTLVWKSPDDVFECVDIAIDSDQVAGLDTALDEKVAKAGDTMTGALNLPSNGLVVGTDQLVVKSGNVGIGTASPNATLHVVGGSVLSERNEATSNPSYFSLRRSRGTVGSPSPLAGSDVIGELDFQGYSATGYAGNLQNAEARIYSTLDSTATATSASTMPASIYFATKANGSTTNATRMTISSDGNVGIGITDPTDALVVARTASSSSPPRIVLTDTQNLGGIHDSDGSADYGLGISADVRSIGNGAIYFSAHTGGGTGTSPYIIFRGGDGPTENANARRIMVLNTNNGNVGIGTTSPAAKLEVQGKARVSASSTTFIGFDPARDLSGLNPGTTTGAGGVIEGPILGSFLLDLRNNQIDDSFALRYSAANTGNVDTIGFVMKGDGNVGIGTTVPSQKLDVVGNINGAQLCIDGDCKSAWPSEGGGGTVTSVATGTGLTGGPVTATGTISIANGGVGTTQLADSSVTDAKISGMAATKLTGTIAAARMPALTGDVTTTVGTTATSVVKVQGRAVSSTAPTTDQVLKWNGSAWAPAADEDSGGSVTSVTGTAPISVTGTTAPTISLASGGVTSTHIADGTITAADLNSSLSGGLWQGSGANVYRSGGNVGIGTSSPERPLHVRGGNGILRVDRDANTVGFQFHRYPTGDYTTPWKGFLIGVTADGADDGKFVIADYHQAVSGSADNRLVIDNTGNIGIGTTTPSEKLEVSGNVLASSYLYTSDRRLKEDIQDINGLESVLKLHGVHFHWKKDGSPEYGLIAQEVEKVLPDLVVTNPKTGIKSVKYGNLVAPLIESVKELSAKIEQVQQENERLTEAFRQVQSENAQMKQQMRGFKEILCRMNPTEGICQ